MISPLLKSTYECCSLSCAIYLVGTWAFITIACCRLNFHSEKKENKKKGKSQSFKDFAFFTHIFTLFLFLYFSIEVNPIFFIYKTTQEKKSRKKKNSLCVNRRFLPSLILRKTPFLNLKNTTKKNSFFSVFPNSFHCRGVFRLEKENGRCAGSRN